MRAALLSIVANAQPLGTPWAGVMAETRSGRIPQHSPTLGAPCARGAHPTTLLRVIPLRTPTRRTVPPPHMPVGAQLHRAAGGPKRAQFQLCRLRVGTRRLRRREGVERQIRGAAKMRAAKSAHCAKPQPVGTSWAGVAAETTRRVDNLKSVTVRKLFISHQNSPEHRARGHQPHKKIAALLVL
jgi:hypothetical protein